MMLRTMAHVRAQRVLALHGSRTGTSTLVRPSFTTITTVLTKNAIAEPPSMAGSSVNAPAMSFPGITFDVTYEPIYRVVLHYNLWQDSKAVARRVKSAVPILSGANALRIVENAQLYGSSIVITVPLDDASMYESRLSRAGLKVTLEIA